MTPAITGIFDSPDFQIAERGSCRYSTGIHCESGSVIGLDRPWCIVSAAATPERECPVRCVCNLFCIGPRQGNHRLSAGDILLRIHTQVFTVEGLNSELEELAYAGVSTDVSCGQYCRLVCSRKHIFQWNRAFRFSAPFVFH